MNELDPEIKKQLDAIDQKTREIFSLEKPQPALELLHRAWDLLPGEKSDWRESYTFSQYLIYVYFRTGDFTKAREWQDEFLKCEQKHRNHGESEMMAGKIAVALNDIEAAKSWFAIANRKSEGREFTGDDKKYKKYLDKKDVRPTQFKALLALASKEMAKNNFSYALSLLYDCLNKELMNPEVYLRKGICHFELGEMDHAADSFTRAFMLEGETIFKNQPPKYFDFLKTKITID